MPAGTGHACAMTTMSNDPELLAQCVPALKARSPLRLLRKSFVDPGVDEHQATGPFR